jgi:hypothetical protein
MIGDDLLDLVEVCDEELEDFLGLLFGPVRMENDITMTGTRKGIDPTMSYRRAINLYVTTEDGQKCTVGDCPATAFAVLMQVSAATAENPEAAAKAIADLDYQHKIDRWYAIMTLAEHGAAIPLFGPAQEPVTLSCGPRKPGRAHDDLLASEASSKRTGYQGIDPTQEYHLALPLSL